MKRRISVWFIIPAFITFSASNVLLPTKERMINSTITLDNMPTRQGSRPSTTNTNPHTQLTQQPEDLSYVESLKDWAFTLSHIQRQPSGISVPGSIAMIMDHDQTCKRCNAFMIGTEFAHFHPHPDHSMHLGVPTEDAKVIIEKGWGEWHPLIKRGFLAPNIIMMYAPRTEEELAVAKFIVGHSYAFAKGELEE